MSDLATLDATAQAELVRQGQLKPIELVEAAIERIERVDPQVNAVVITTFDRALADAASGDLPAGPFTGVPTMLKDCQPSKGDPSTQGIPRLQEIGWREDHDASIVAKLRRAGLVFVGRTNMPQIQSGITTEPDLYGPTHNPWRSGYSPGGSSGGSAAAVAAGLVPMAHAVDGGGSIRIPSSACGVVGLKPSRGRTSMGPAFGDGVDFEGYNCAHVITRSVRDSAAVLDAVAGPMPGDQYAAPLPTRPYVEELNRPPAPLRIGMWTQSASFPAVHADCVAATEMTAGLLESLGHVVEPAYPGALEEGLIPAFFTFAAVHIGASVADIEQRTGVQFTEDDLDEVVWLAAQGAKQVGAVDLVRAVDELRGFARRWASWWAGGFDLLLTPTLAVTPYPHGALSRPGPGEPWPDVQPWIPFTAQYNISGQPAISLPLHWNDDGMPIGVMLGAAFGREDQLLAVAAQLEEAAPWASRRPPIHA